MNSLEAVEELQRRRKARSTYHDYLQYINPWFKTSGFSLQMGNALDKFEQDVHAGKRPIAIFEAPPQHGKSEIVSRTNPARLASRNPDWHIGILSYASSLADGMLLNVRQTLESKTHRALYPPRPHNKKQLINRSDMVSIPGGRGTLISGGVGTGIAGKPLDIGIIDDPIKDAEEALSPTISKRNWNWYLTVFNARLSENSGQIIMGTNWGQNTLPSMIYEHYKGDPRLSVYKFPALNYETETGFNPNLPLGPLVPHFKSEAFLREVKALNSAYWWAAMYQQNPQVLGGNIFIQAGLQYYFRGQLPERFDRMIMSVDCAFENKSSSDDVAIQVWGKKGAHSFLLDQMLGKMSFTQTLENILQMKKSWKYLSTVLVEGKANGDAVLDVLKGKLPGLKRIVPTAHKEVRAHAVTAFWEAKNIWLPHPDTCPWIKTTVDSLLLFPAAAQDGDVDALSQALSFLYPPSGILKISPTVIETVMRSKAR